MTARTRTFTAAAAAALLALALAACGGPAEQTPDGVGGTEPAPTGATSEPTGPEPSEAPSPPPSDAPSAEPSGQPTTDLPFTEPGTVVEEKASAEAFLTVTDVRAATHKDFDRVVFDLGGDGTPGWRVEYVEAALDDGSGLPVGVDGDAVLQVRISGVGLPTDTGIDEFAGAPVDLDGEGIEEVVYRFTFEGYATAFVGADERTPFRVFALSNPTRLVVDVQHARD